MLDKEILTYNSYINNVELPKELKKTLQYANLKTLQDEFVRLNSLGRHIEAQMVKMQIQLKELANSGYRNI
jgi:tRNA G26 N,N-dimethylase Trm1